MTARNQSLDVLRGIAVLLVLGRHFKYFNLWWNIGWIGVDLFFVLSGFLISGLLFSEIQRTGTIDLKRFWVRRGFKIWPAFYFFLLCMAAITMYSDHGALRWKPAFLASAAFLRNYVIAPPDTIGHSWSLAVEEHFYLLLPVLLVLLIWRGSVHHLPRIFACVAIGCLALRVLLQSPHTDAMATQFRIDSLFAGVMLSYFRYFHPALFARMNWTYAPLITVICCIPEAILPSTSRFVQTAGLSLMYVGFSFLVAWAFPRVPVAPISRLAHRAVARIGFYSYSIYLWHMPIAIVFGMAFRHSAIAFAMYVASSLGLGIAAAHAVEVPFLKVRDRWLAHDRHRTTPEEHPMPVEDPVAGSEQLVRVNV